MYVGSGANAYELLPVLVAGGQILPITSETFMSVVNELSERSKSADKHRGRGSGLAGEEAGRWGDERRGLAAAEEEDKEQEGRSHRYDLDISRLSSSPLSSSSSLPSPSTSSSISRSLHRHGLRFPGPPQSMREDSKLDRASVST